MKIRVCRDERYPCYDISDKSYEPEIEVTQEEYDFIIQAEKDYKKAQAILKRAYTRGGEKRFEGSGKA